MPKSDRDPLTDQVIGFTIEVHRELGPGLLESAYDECLYHELDSHEIAFRRQVPLYQKLLSTTFGISCFSVPLCLCVSVVQFVVFRLAP